ncbi:hypothetical protein ACQJBY_053286 [Aegilops geniculata]
MMAAVAVGMASCSGTLLILILFVGIASKSALVGNRCAAGSQSPSGAGMRCASCSPLAGNLAPPPRSSSSARPRGLHWWATGAPQVQRLRLLLVRRGIAVAVRRRDALLFITKQGLRVDFT